MPISPLFFLGTRAVARAAAGATARHEHSRMPDKMAKLSFWGVRGSIPTVDQATWRYGGNTPCLELVAPDGTLFILDCGTGLRLLGNRWAETYGEKAPEAHIFVTRYHWDHIQGIPFFAPLYDQQNHLNFYRIRYEL